MNSLYLVRHGENLANITREFSYKKVDYSLTPKGMLQAQQTAEFFKSKQIHEIYASPLKRARETAEIIAQVLGLDVVLVEDFREVNVGALEGQTPSAENWDYHNEIINDWYENRCESTFRGGENYWTLLARMRRGLGQILEDKSGRNIIIVGHGGLFTFTLKDICRNVAAHEVWHTENRNCSITEIAARSRHGIIEAELRSWAACTHLSDAAGSTARDMRAE